MEKKEQKCIDLTKDVDLNDDKNAFETEYYKSRYLDAKKCLDQQYNDIRKLREENFYFKKNLDCQIKNANYLQFKVDSILSSTSWKVTGLIRYLGRALTKTLYRSGIKTRKTLDNPLFLSLTADRRKTEQAVVFDKNPVVSIIVPIYNTPIPFLIKMIESVRKQTYQHWELCLGDASDAAHNKVSVLCKKFARKDSRIKYCRLAHNGGISENSNQTIAVSTGEYIGLLDHDDILHYSAIFEVVKAINEKGADFVYTDEATIRENPSDAYLPHFKPDFAADNLRGNNYICHFSVFSRALMERSGGHFRKEYDGAQDHELFLRLTEKAKKIAHIPRILYYWRAHEQSTASGTGAKPYVVSAGKRAVEAQLERIGLPGVVKPLPKIGTVYRVEYALRQMDMISILIPNKDHIVDLEKCINSILGHSTYKNYEIIVIENNSVEKQTFRYYSEIVKNEKIRVVTWDGPFNYSAINNYGATFAKGKYLLLLNNDIEVSTPDWLEEMLMFAQREDVGAVGAKLYYPDDTIQHAGIGIGLLTLAGHFHRGMPRNYSGYMGRLSYAQNVTAVTGACLMLRREVFDEVGGLEESFEVAFNDVDFCMKLRARGYLNIFTPFAELYHYESKSRGLDISRDERNRFEGEVNRFQIKWQEELAKGDPYFNPNFSLDKEDFSYE